MVVTKTKEAEAVAPVRLQLSRRKGFRLQEVSRAINGLEAVICARPGRHGNPFIIGKLGTAADAVSAYRAYVNTDACRDRIRTSLTNSNLACYCGLCDRHKAPGKPLDTPCPDCDPCHVDVLGEIVLANPHPA